MIEVDPTRLKVEYEVAARSLVPSWDRYFLDMCKLVSSRSKDQSTKVGCVIVGPDNEVRSTGYNGFPRGANDTNLHWHERPIKYKVTEHAERNAIYNAARMGTALKGCRIYVPWMPCTDCARGIIQSGIISVILDGTFEMPEDLKARWAEDHLISSEMFLDCGVDVMTRGK